MKTKKIRFNFKKIIKKFFTTILTIMIIYNITFFAYNSITKKDFIELFKISLFSNETDAMEDELHKNDLVIAKKSKLEDLIVGDIVIWKEKSKIRINKLIDIYNSYEDGKKVYVTKYNKNYQPDIEQIDNNKIIGRKIVNIKNMGIVLKILQSKITTIFIFILLCIYFIYNKKIYTRNRERKRKKIKYKLDNYKNKNES